MRLYFSPRTLNQKRHGLKTVSYGRGDLLVTRAANTQKYRKYEAREVPSKTSGSNAGSNQRYPNNLSDCIYSPAIFMAFVSYSSKTSQ